jgi:hypothetical protein
VLAADGTVTKCLKPSNVHEQRVYKGHKGHGWNSVFVFDAAGCVCDAVLLLEGCYGDARIARKLLQRHWDPAINVDRLGMIIDNGWHASKDFSAGAPGSPPARIRPLRTGDYVNSENKTFIEKCSRMATVYRQQNEHGNGQLKRSYCCLERPRSTRQRAVLLRDMEVCVRLNNLRSRRVGWNQVRTTILRHTDANVRGELLFGRRRGAEALLRRLRARSLVQSLRKRYDDNDN